MARRGTNLRPIIVMVALAVVGVLLIGVATAGLAATAGATGTTPAWLFGWLPAGHEATPPPVAQPCITDLLTAAEGPRAAVLVPGDDAADCGS